MNNDKRLFILRNKEVLLNNNVESTVTEYEVIVDAHIAGEYKYEPYYFTIWEFSNKQEGEKRKLCLQIKEKNLSHDEQLGKSANRSGFYHGGGIADELVVLASLFLRRRITLGRIVRMDNKPRLFSLKKLPIDKCLIAGESNLSDLTEWFKYVEGLNPIYHQKFILAVKLYHLAIQLIEEHPDLAYLNLIASIELLCQNFDIGKISIANLNDDKLKKVIKSISNKEKRKQIKQEILKRERFIGRRFVKFIIEHIKEDKEFWRDKNRPKIGKVKRKELPKLLNRIYNQRSKTLHEGIPFPVAIFDPPMNKNAEIDFSGGVISGEKKYEQKEFIPYPHFFERLVNHVLKNFLKRNQK